MPSLDLDTYAQDIKTVAAAITNVRGGGRRIQRKGSPTVADVHISVGNVPKITALIKEDSLYVKGFRAGTRSFYFKGENGGANELKFGCNYADPGGLAILATGSGDARTSRSRNDVVKALNDLAGFNQTNDLHLKVPLAIVAHIVSEAIRFTSVYHVFVDVMKRGGTFSFAELECYTQYWKKLSDGEAVPGAIADSVFTYHH